MFIVRSRTPKHLAEEGGALICLAGVDHCLDRLLIVVAGVLRLGIDRAEALWMELSCAAFGGVDFVGNAVDCVSRHDSTVFGSYSRL
ncbi:hypothetical protein LIA77_00303 [Sarocladium implicatum]|jgi:hypothetical protein|nr:hypothetical protein LIA77_00303 [Sarocladium implicatum]